MYLIPSGEVQDVVLRSYSLAIDWEEQDEEEFIEESSVCLNIHHSLCGYVDISKKFKHKNFVC